MFQSIRLMVESTIEQDSNEELQCFLFHPMVDGGHWWREIWINLKKKWFDSFFQGKTIEFVSYLHEFCSDSEENDLICWGRGSAVGGGGGGWRDLGDRLFHLKKWSWHHHHRVDWNWKTHKMALVIRMFHCYITFTSMQISSGFCLIICFSKKLLKDWTNQFGWSSWKIELVFWRVVWIIFDLNWMKMKKISWFCSQTHSSRTQQKQPEEWKKRDTKERLPNFLIFE